MRTGRPKTALVLTAEQREPLESLARRRTTAQALALRARIVLALAHALAGQKSRLESEQRRPDLACLRFAAAPQRSFKLSTDPLLIEQIRDIVGLYLNPPHRAAVLCVEEKPQIQAEKG